jgi:hypothetical protein
MLELIIGIIVGIGFGVSVTALAFGRKTDALLKELEAFVELVGGLRP